MSTAIYFFSATGNSLSSARLMAKYIKDDVKLIPAASLKDCDKIVVDADAVGFAFPIYHADMPYILRCVIEKMEFKNDPYVFSICTYSGRFGEIAWRMEDVLAEKGLHLAISLGLAMPGNARVTPPEDIEKMLESQEEKCREIADKINNRERENYSEHEFVAPSEYAAGPANLQALKADETCIGCGTCVSVCPMGNIKVENGRAIIGDNCICCLACFHWCPKEAIYRSKVQDASARRIKYHHPDVAIEDISSQK